MNLTTQHSLDQLAQFAFECPRCHARITMDAAQRGRRMRCHHCKLDLPGPVFARARLGEPDLWSDDTYVVTCEHCGHATHALASAAGRERICGACGRSCVQPAPPWDRWRRVVAKVLTPDDQRRSLHHLIHSGESALFDDAELEAIARRRFMYYCGGCGKLHEARVFDIARQLKCVACDVLMIVPAPRGAGNIVDPEIDRLIERATRFCPQCGQELEHTGPSRVRCTRCAADAEW